MNATMPLVGSLVGASRWPYACSHPDGWQAPWSGEVLALDDPRAWKGSIAFHGTDLPDAGAVSAHVASLRLRGLLSNTVPVLWDFGTYARVWWETPANVRPYALDVLAWQEARAARRADYGTPLRATYGVA